MIGFIQDNFLVLITILILVVALIVGLMVDGRIFKKKKNNEKKEDISVSSSTNGNLPDNSAVGVVGAAAATAVVASDLATPVEEINSTTVDASLPADIYTPIEEVPALHEETVKEVSSDDRIISVLDTPVAEGTIDFVSNVTADESNTEVIDFQSADSLQSSTLSAVGEAVVTDVPKQEPSAVSNDEQPIELIDESAFFNSHLFDEESEETQSKTTTEVVSEQSIFDDVQTDVTLPEVDTAKNADETTEDTEWKF